MWSYVQALQLMSIDFRDAEQVRLHDGLKSAPEDFEDILVEAEDVETVSLLSNDLKSLDDTDAQEYTDGVITRLG